MASIAGYIESLESYAAQSGARLIRSPLPHAVHGRVLPDAIVLRPDLDPEQELHALVHELAHWLAHRDAPPGPGCTIFEYEAEAVEALVMMHIGLQPPGDAAESPTDGLLHASVGRVVRASRRICDALDMPGGPRPP